MRTFPTGANRSNDTEKPDYEGYLSPLVIRAYGRYMQTHSIQEDGVSRASDNWQRGIPRAAYMKSGWRHFLDWWSGHRAGTDVEDAICALLFNAMGYLHTLLQEQANTDAGAKLDSFRNRALSSRTPFQ